jgi:hypothetical protein
MARESQQTERERAVFELFLKANPSFADQVKSFDAAAEDFPDITVNLRAGNSIGYELGEWLDRGQMAKSKRDESFKRSLLEAVVPCSDLRPRNFEFVLLDPKRRDSFDKSDASGFCDEFRSLVEEVERCWPREPSWHYPPGHFADDLSDYPTIQKYIRIAHFFPCNPFPLITRALEAVANDPEILRLNEPACAEAVRLWTGQFVEVTPPAPRWVAVTDRDHAYTSESAINALRKRLVDKLNRYGRTREELMLIVYYDQALLYNTPYSDQINFDTFADVAHEASQFMRGLEADSKFPFKKVFLLKALWPEPEAFEIWPTLTQCG